jgi:alpha-ketoglutarate-dependent taurine dioxygenase
MTAAANRGVSELRTADVDAATVTSKADFDQSVRTPWLEAGVLCLRSKTNGAGVTPLEHVRFSRWLGELDIHVAEQFLLPTQREILQITNMKRDDGTAIGFEEAGRYWHSDMSCESQLVLLWCCALAACLTLSNSRRPALSGSSAPDPDWLSC